MTDDLKVENLRAMLLEMERRMIAESGLPEEQRQFKRRYPDGPRYFGDISYEQIVDALAVIGR